MIIREYKKPYSWTSLTSGKKTLVNESMIELKCDQCGLTHSRVKKQYRKMKNNTNFTKDFCNKCWQSLQNNLPDRRKKNSEAQTKRYEDVNERKKTSKSMKGKVNVGEKNAMKRPEVRRRVSITRTKLMKDPEFRKKFSQGSIDA